MSNEKKMTGRYKVYRIMNAIMLVMSLLHLSRADGIRSICFSFAVVTYAFATKALLESVENKEVNK